MASIYVCAGRQPASEDFSKSVNGISLLLKKSKDDGRLAIINVASGDAIWVTSDIQNETRDEKILTVQTVNSVYTFRKIGETV